MVETKICTKCKLEKSISKFYYDKKRNKHQSRCSGCVQDARPSMAKTYLPTAFIDLEGEIWQDIPNTNSIYQGSNLSRVRSIDRYSVDVNGVKRYVKGQILKQHLVIDEDGRKYYNVCICVKNKKKTSTVHSLIFSAFNGFAPTRKSGMVVDHDDNNPLNNNLENLKLITHRENSSKDRKRGASKYVGVSWRKDSNKWSTAIGINGKGQIKIFFSINEDLCGLAYKIALKNLDKYDGDNAKFREMIKSIMRSASETP